MLKNNKELNRKKIIYVAKRLTKHVQLCLAFVELSISTDNPWPERVWNIVAAVIKKKIKAKYQYNNVDKKARFFLDTLHRAQEERELRITFWCQSGTKCFKPTNDPSNKENSNCVEVAIFGFTKVIMEALTNRGEVDETEIKYMTDLSPCRVCTRRIPIQERQLADDFPNTKFSHRREFVIAYEEYANTDKKKWRDEKVWIKVLEDLRRGGSGVDMLSS